MAVRTALVILLLLGAAAPVAAAALTSHAHAPPFHGPVVTPVCAERGAGPPCGQINPRLVLSFQGLDPSQHLTLEGNASLVFTGNVTFVFNAGDEGYAPEDPAQPIELRFAFPRRPFWADMTVEPAIIPISPITPENLQASGDPAAPTVVYRRTWDVTLTVKALQDPWPTPGYPYAKLQVFGKSSQSGIYNPGYGIKELRILTEDVAPADDPGIVGAPAASAWAVAGALALGAVVAAAARRGRRRDNG